tara:strand:+ start:53 stop:784 length:732 start_codon:yes stop_codon:yes gene_type:complete
MAQLKFPTEEVTLPSKGLVYPETNPLSNGKIEIKYMTAKEEDILSNQSYIQDGSVLDRLLDSVIVTENVKSRDLIIGDKNAVLVATRILGYGKNYDFRYAGETITTDLTNVKDKPIDESLFTKGKNEFAFTLPHSENKITFKILDGHDDFKVKREVEGIQKVKPKSNPELSTKLKYMILSVNGESDKKTVREFVDNFLLARDSRALRDYVSEFQPDVNLTHIMEDGEEVGIPIGIGFFWPDFQ